MEGYRILALDTFLVILVQLYRTYNVLHPTFRTLSVEFDLSYTEGSEAWS